MNTYAEQLLRSAIESVTRFQRDSIPAVGLLCNRATQAADEIGRMDKLLARAADALNASAVVDDTHLGYEITKFRRHRQDEPQRAGEEG